MKVKDHLLYDDNGVRVTYKQSPNHGGTEEWKYINGFDEKYEISNYGNIRSCGYWAEHENRYFKPRLRKPSNKENFYKTIKLTRYTGNLYVHRLVASHFIDNPYNLPCVNHIDADRANNHVDNLEWVTYSANQIHSNRETWNYDNTVLDTENGVFYSNVKECYEHSGIKTTYGNFKAKLCLTSKRINNTKYLRV